MLKTVQNAVSLLLGRHLPISVLSTYANAVHRRSGVGQPCLNGQARARHSAYATHNDLSASSTTPVELTTLELSSPPLSQRAISNTRSPFSFSPTITESKTAPVYGAVLMFARYDAFSRRNRWFPDTRRSASPGNPRKSRGTILRCVQSRSG